VASGLPERAHGGDPADHARVAELVADLRGHERVVFAAPRVLGETLDRLGVTRYSVAGAPECRTFSYVADGERDLWVVNSSTLPQDLAVRLDAPIEGGELEELTDHTGPQAPVLERPRVDGPVLRVALPPKTVRAFRFAYETAEPVASPAAPAAVTA
jgi:hypothetical protein